MKKKLVLILLFLVIFITGCGEQPVQNKEDKKCNHVWIDGVCINCNEECAHEYENGECKICMMKCIHEYKDGKCIHCDQECEHDYNNGTCTICLSKCTNHKFENGKCKICNISSKDLCEHSFTDEICEKCGYKCNHETCENGKCVACKKDISINCKHKYENGSCIKCDYHCQHTVFGNSKCVECGWECTHEGFTCGDECETCGKKLEHNYVKAKCTNCGEMLEFTDTAIPDKYLNTNCPEKGTVEKVVFQSYDYANSRPYENTFFVYLPYGYDKNSEKEYNVLYLLHGSGENAAYWLAQLSYAGGYTEKTKVLLDNMHYYKLCEETIVVTPTQRLNGTANFYKELLNNIMPLAETMYKTKAHLYSKDVSTVKADDFISSRDYRAYAGLSQGSMIGWSVLAYYQPYFSYYGFYSGGPYGLTTYYNDAKKSMSDPKFAQYDIKYAYHSCGDDAMYNDHIDSYKGLLGSAKNKLTDGVNTNFLPKPKFGHTYSAWIIDLYNSLGLRFFKYNEEE